MDHVGHIWRSTQCPVPFYICGNTSPASESGGRLVLFPMLHKNEKYLASENRVDALGKKEAGEERSNGSPTAFSPETKHMLQSVAHA